MFRLRVVGCFSTFSCCASAKALENDALQFKTMDHSHNTNTERQATKGKGKERSKAVLRATLHLFSLRSRKEQGLLVETVWRGEEAKGG